ncbi:putative membrane protein [Sporomusaceae bacterium BoRhaA]|uniref:hypothetical protein n=1 Tax=Pelorhabdus rhamnosifermentans TaxID=2772457 RepID=UPI001C063F06|nr:hypothetical protein [Pelorhabdus rhamnosifermentans]MBU2699813.1 putative membrane protein [Pelorhabdus rhamnosifermentans]
MTKVLNSRELDRALREDGKPVVASEKTSESIFRLLLFTLLMSAISSILAIAIAIMNRQAAKADDKKKEQAEKNIKKELQELHEEIVALKKST